MILKRVARISLFALGFGLALLITYEAYAVWRAESRSEQIIAAALSKPQPLSIADLSPQQLDILLKVEDPGFFSHHGIDVSSPGQGMTTITQALVKLLYFDPFKPGFAKIEQSLIARLVLDRHLTKNQQLTLYLNQTYFGAQNGATVRGFSDAARAYFGKTFDRLTTDEFIGLVGMLIGPNALQPDRHPEAHKDRVARIKKLIAGSCQPVGVFDPWYKNCAKKS